MSNTEQDNMKLWKSVERTNPAYTKKVTFGRAITAIDPYRQVEAATKAFGPAGQGWGWSIKMVERIEETKQIALLVSVWVKKEHPTGGSTIGTIEQWGQNGIYIDNKCLKKDEDCFKKATTDGITKCLSYMGFNADIFLGKYDDNKYVQAMKEEFSEPKKAPAKKIDIIKELMLKGFDECDLKAVYEKSTMSDQQYSEGWADPKRQGGLIEYFKKQIEGGK